MQVILPQKDRYVLFHFWNENFVTSSKRRRKQSSRKQTLGKVAILIKFMTKNYMKLHQK